MMRRILWLAAAAAICVSPPPSRCQNQDQQQGQGSAAAPAAGPSSGGAPQESLADAARRLREQKKATPKAAKVFTNDNLTGAAEVTAAPARAGAAPAAAGKAEGAAAGAPAAGPDEAAWRAKFASLRHKLEQDQADLAVMQRELGTLSLQRYDDPNKALAQQFTREDINKKTADIEAKKKQIEADKQAIDDAETELRKAGGNSGWAR
jgi:chromosome segregation ATPase